MPFSIPYKSDGFAAGSPVMNGAALLQTSWEELLWAALTVGRPNRMYVFKHAIASSYEALFRLSLVRMAVEQESPGSALLRRTSAATSLDPTEKGAVSYFLGLAVAKLFASRLLDAPWLLHLDVFRPALNPILIGRSRPDLVGITTGGDWVVLECKGRGSVPSDEVIQKAKGQAGRLVQIFGATPICHVGAITYFQNDILKFLWQDPEPGHSEDDAIEVSTDGNVWRHYYAPVLGLIRSYPDHYEQMRREPLLVPVEGADIQVGIHPRILSLLIESRWEEIMSDRGPEINRSANIAYRSDGIAVVAGQSWLQPFTEAL